MREIPHSPVALFEVAHPFGTLIAETILASVHMRARKQAGHTGASDLIKALQNTLQGGGRSLIAALLSRSLFTSPARVMVLFAVSASCRNIWSGPEDRHCKVHNGLTLITRPPARRAIACTLALGRCVLAYLTSFDELRCHGRRGPAERLARSPDTVQDDGQLARQGYSGLA